MKESVNRSAFARIVGDLVPELDKLDEALKKYALKEKVGDRKLSEINNTAHENFKNQKGFEVPENVMKSSDDLGVGRSVSNNSSPSYPQTSNNGEASQNCTLLQHQSIQDLEQKNDKLMEELLQKSDELMQYLREPDLPDLPDILTFHIPLTDGLGVIVEGRSTLTANGSRDLGIFIKTVTPGGAASKDGRLQTNDRIVSIGGIGDLRGISNRSAMELLCAAMTKSAIFLTVERITGQVGEPSPNCGAPAESSSTRAGVDTEGAQGPGLQKKRRIPDLQLLENLLEKSCKSMENYLQENEKLMQDLKEPDLSDLREILTFGIPLIDELGIIVEGRSTLTANGSRDLGIFIKTLTPGGAASKDGRLQVNDRLVYIDGVSLRRMSNGCAVEMLGAAMTRHSIFLTVERITGQVGEHCKPPRVEGEGAQEPGMQRKQHIRDEASESLFGLNGVLILISLLLVLLFLYVIYISKNVFALIGLCL